MPQLPGVRIVHVLVALAALALACGVCAASAVAQVVTDPATHQRFGIEPPLTGPHAAAATAGTSCTTDCSALLYHGGPVQHGETDYLFFWLPSGYSFPSGYESGLKAWLDGVASADGSTENPFSVDTQYYDTSGPGGSHSDVPYAIHDPSPIIDTDPFPASLCSDTDDSGTAQPVCITDGEIQDELSSYISTNGLPTGPNVEYFVLTPGGVGSCFSSPGSSGNCSYTGYCGYHSFIGSGSSQILYADLPWAYQVPGCDVNDAFGAGYPNSGGIDPVVSVFSHELSETMTDPHLNAWYDSSGNEIGDKCAYTYGSGGYGSMSGLNTNGLGYWNVPLLGGDYLMQTEYDQRDGNCAVGLTTTWSGEWTAGSGWSQSGNWVGVLPPQSPVDTLAFPALTNPVCASAPGTGTCYSSANNVSGLSAHALSIDDGVGYSITGDALTLGAGGISATTSASSPTASTLGLPVTLSAGQTWSISGRSGVPGAALALAGAVAGAGEALQIDLSNQAGLDLAADAEVGTTTVSGANPGESGADAAQNGTLTSTSSLNGTDRAGVTLSDIAMVTGAGAATGPLTSTGASLQVGQGQAGALSVAGALSLDPASRLTLFLDGPGAIPGSDYSQISAAGPVNLSGALQLTSGTIGCPALIQGQPDTLITATGPISGTFSGIPNGALVTLSCGAASPTVQITYTANAVIATAVSPAPLSLVAPTIAGLAEPGQTLIEVPGVWANAPTSIEDQWERCDTSGANCAPIANATGQQYALSAADLGSTIRVEEVATNANGSTTAQSAPTAVVAAPTTVVSTPTAPTTPNPANPPASPSSSSSGGSSAGPGSPGSSGLSAAQLRAVLLEALASAGKSARLGELLAHGGYSVSISLPGGGVLVVSWSMRPAKPGHGRQVGAPALVALGRAGSAHAGAVALKVRLTAQGRRRLARHGKLTLTVTVTFTPAGSHQAVTAGRTFALHR